MLPRLSDVRRAAATGTMQEDSNIAENPTIIQQRAVDEVVDPPRDGDCLFHCFYQCLENAPWIDDWAMYREKINNVNDMRHFIIKYMRRNADLFEADHSGYIRDAVAGWLERDINSLTYEEAMPVYCRRMKQPTMWGGPPELDAGAMLLNVIVHQFFVPFRDGALATARLSTSFYPDPALSREENAAARAPYTKFVFILQNDHYYFALPRVPRALRAGSGSSSGSDGSSSDDGVSAQERVQLLNSLRARNSLRASAAAARKPKGNAALKALAAEREARARARAVGNGGACARKPVTLTDGQREEMEVEDGDAAYARRLAEQERNDAALARELAKQWG